MTDDFNFVSSEIDEQKDLLHNISQDIWRNPELRYQETHAHNLLSCNLVKFGFEVQKHYVLDTAFRAEFVSQRDGGPTVAILLEYDALPGIGHACGHNLIAEAGLAAALAIKGVMDKDSSIAGKLVVLGTPAEESGGGKIRLIEGGVFGDIDIALMVHPSIVSSVFSPFLCNLRGKVEFKGKEAHAAAFPWEGINALDAAVACYNSLSLLRQQIKPTERIHAIITEGGVVTNVIPGTSKMEIAIRTSTVGDLKVLKSRIAKCIEGAAGSTGCIGKYAFEEQNAYQNVISNKVLGNLYGEYFEKAGQSINEDLFSANAGSTDMGNVSHILPAIHPFFAIPSKGVNHTKEFAQAAGDPAAQPPTLAAAKAMAMTALTVMRNPDTLELTKSQFATDILKDMEC